MLHPLRQRIARQIASGEELGVAELAAELGEARGRISYHLRILVRRGVLKVVPKRRPTPPLYRWHSDAQWAREMLDGEGER
jgi:DNA-binding transcriptional ArsR family regulator